ncbi:unnamed protein product [Allacma fusca]|uniref:Uncharacterized protein n=1 Tax=Allacma fusca TaxID=39272 RepID=A0A8J2LKU7_9HEXA|nr:unnamed protein product [Allacma fusca]
MLSTKLHLQNIAALLILVRLEAGNETLDSFKFGLKDIRLVSGTSTAVLGLRHYWTVVYCDTKAICVSYKVEELWLLQLFLSQYLMGTNYHRPIPKTGSRRLT